MRSVIGELRPQECGGGKFSPGMYTCLYRGMNDILYVKPELNAGEGKYFQNWGYIDDGKWAVDS